MSPDPEEALPYTTSETRLGRAGLGPWSALGRAPRSSHLKPAVGGLRRIVGLAPLQVQLLYRER